MGGVVGAAGSAVRRPRKLLSRRDALVTRAVSDGEAVDKGLSSLESLGLDDINVNVEDLSRCVHTRRVRVASCVLRAPLFFFFFFLPSVVRDTTNLKRERKKQHTAAKNRVISLCKNISKVAHASRARRDTT